MNERAVEMAKDMLIHASAYAYSLDAFDVADLLDNMICILRHITSDDDWVELREEMHVVEAYFRWMRQRFGLAYSISDYSSYPVCVPRCEVLNFVETHVGRNQNFGLSHFSFSLSLELKVGEPLSAPRLFLNLCVSRGSITEHFEASLEV